MNNMIEVDISFKDENVSEIIFSMQEAGVENVEEVKQRGLMGSEIILFGVIAATAIANLIIRLLPLFKCGLIIDARGEKILTEKSCDLPQGTVLVIGPDGTQSKLHEPSELEIGSLIEKLAIPS